MLAIMCCYCEQETTLTYFIVDIYTLNIVLLITNKLENV